MKKILSIGAILLIVSSIFQEFPIVMAPIENWHSTTPLPAPSSGHCSVVHDGRIYVVGGSTPTSGIRSDKVRYASVQSDGHIDSDGWLFTEPLLDPRIFGAANNVVIYNDRIYVLGGSANQPGWIERDTVWYTSFNPDGTIGDWITTTSLPYHVGDISAVAWNDRIYILAGWTGFDYYNYVHYAEIDSDGSLGSWITTTSLPERRAHGHRAVVHNGIIYFMGGTTGYTGPPTIHNEIYYAPIQASGEVGAWTETALPVGLSTFSAFVYGEDIFVMGGENESLALDDRVYKAHINPDGSLDSWVEWGRLPERLHVHSSVVLDDRVYMIGGGREDGSDSDTVYFTNLPSELVQARVELYENYGKIIDPWHWQNRIEEIGRIINEDYEESWFTPLGLLIKFAKKLVIGHYSAAEDITKVIVGAVSLLKADSYSYILGEAYREADLRYLLKYGTLPPIAPDEMQVIRDLVEEGKTSEARPHISTLIDYLHIVKEEVFKVVPLFPHDEENKPVVADFFAATISFLNAEYLSYSEDTSAFMVSVLSPVNILVTAPNGFRIGYDSVTGTVVSEIEGATYSGLGTEPQLIVIPSPSPGDFIIDLYGTDVGTYTLTVEFVAEDGTIVDSETWTGTTYLGELDRKNVQLLADGNLEPSEEKPVGGFEAPLNNLRLLITWILVILATFGAIVASKRKRKH